MAAELDANSLLLPELARLFHIGLAKTGTTSLQHAAHAARARMLSQGVRCPGKRVNHNAEVSGLMGRRIPWAGPGAPVQSRRPWDKMMEEVAADDVNRIFISHEFASSADSATAKRFIDSLGPRAHIVVTLRGLGDLLASSWQQYVQAGMTFAFDDWLELVLGERADPTVSRSFHQRKDHAALIDRWSSLVGAENVTVIVVDKSHPQRLAQAFEGLLGLKEGTIAEAPTRAYSSNRTMTWPEAELVREFNTKYKMNEISWSEHVEFVRHGAVKRLLNNRMPPAGEPSIPVPPWAINRANEISAESAAKIADSGVRIVGDLNSLQTPVKEPVEWSDVEKMPADISVELLTGMFSASLHRGAFFGPKPKPKPSPKPKPKAPVKKPTNAATRPQDRRPAAIRAADTYTTHQLAKALRVRLAHKIRTGKSRPRKR